MAGRLRYGRGHAGFTLLELLVSIGILSVVAGAIGATLYGGIRVWERSRNFQLNEAALFPGWSLLERDLANAGLVIEELPFEGNGSTVSFAALLNTQDETGVETAGQLGHIKYQYDSRRKILFRKSWLYPADEPPGELAAERVLSNLDRFDLQYLDVEGLADQRWRQTWESATNAPVAIRVHLESGVGNHSFELTRTLVLPMPPAEEDEE